MGYLNSFQGHLLPYTYTRTIQEMPEIYHPRSGIPVQGPAFRFVHSTLGVHRDPKGGETDGHTDGHTQELVNNMSATRLTGELEPKQDFSFVGYQFDLRSDRSDWLQTGGSTFKRKC